MNNSITTSKDITQTTANATSEISKVSSVVMTISAASIGCWALACLFAGTVASGGPSGLLTSLVTTITG